jgi:eukaryotic-like serine/threonine-protein kinase
LGSGPPDADAHDVRRRYRAGLVTRWHASRVREGGRRTAAQPLAQAADGRGPADRLTSTANVQVPASITPDGAFVVAVERRAQTGSGLVLFALTRPADAVASRLSASKPLIEQPFTEQNGEVSPDGRFLAYESNESGRFEIYVRPYPRVADGRWQISLAGGTRPAWTRAGREVVYLDAANHLTAVPVEIDGAAVRAGAAATLTTTSYATTIVAWRTYDISPNGERFLVLKEETGVSNDNSQAGFVVVHNWLDELRRAVPVEQRR